MSYLQAELIKYSRGKHPNSRNGFKKGATYLNGFLGKKHRPESIRKMIEAQTGPKSHFWKGGLTSLMTRIRNSNKYTAWRTAIYKRDDYSCVLCGVRGERLHADHIKPFCVIVAESSIETYEQAQECEELWDINNGRTLCVPCHKKTETFSSKVKKFLPPS